MLVSFRLPAVQELNCHFAIEAFRREVEAISARSLRQGSRLTSRFTLEDGIYRSFRNVCKELPLLAVILPCHLKL